MDTIRWTVAVLVLAAAGATVAQQPPADRPCAAASGAMMQGCGAGPHARGRPEDVPGWSMMTPEERQAHRERMAGFKGYDECKAYMDQHQALMAARAKERGMPGPGRSRGDACAPLKAPPKK